jgi:hypothetical protein
VDGTLLPLAFKPTLNGEDYFTRNDGYAINAMMVCDDKARVTYALARAYAPVVVKLNVNYVRGSSKRREFGYCADVSCTGEIYSHSEAVRYV